MTMEAPSNDFVALDKKSADEIIAWVNSHDGEPGVPAAEYDPVVGAVRIFSFVVRLDGTVAAFFNYVGSLQQAQGLLA